MAQLNDQIEMFGNVLSDFNKKLTANVRSLNTLNSESIAAASTARANMTDLRDQADSAADLVKSMEKISGYIDNMNADFDSTRDKVAALNKVTKSFADDILGNLPSKIKKKYAPLFNTLEGLSNLNKKMGLKSLIEGVKSFGGEISSVFGAMKGVEDGPGRFIKQMNIGLGFMGKTGSKMLGPVASGFLLVADAVISVTFQMAKMGAQFTKFVVALPLKMTSAAAKIGNALRSEIVETIGNTVESFKEFFDISEEFGGTISGSIQESRKFAEQNIILFKDVSSELVKLYGTGAQGAAQFSQAFAKNLQDLGTFSDLFASTFSGGDMSQNASRMVAFDKLRREMALSSEDMAYFALDAKSTSSGILNTLYDVRTAIFESAKSFGLNAKLFGKNFMSLRKDIVNFGHLTNDQLSETVGRLTQMGVAMKEASAIFSKLDTFESAAQTSAMLSQTFGMNVDALQLIKEEDPANIIQTFSDAMLATGRSFSELNRHEKAVMAQTTGLSAEALKATMSFMDLGMSYEEAQKKLAESDPTERQIKQLETMTGSLKEIKKIVSETSFFGAFGEGLKNTILYSTGLNEKLKTVSSAMENFFTVGLDLSKNQKIVDSFNKMMSPVSSVLDEMVGDGKSGGIFDSDKLSKAAEPFFTSIGDLLGDAFSDGSDIPKIQENFLAKITSVFDPKTLLTNPKNPTTQLLTLGGKFVGKLLKGFAAVGPGLLTVIGDALTGVVNFITNEGSLFGNSGIGTHLANLFGLSEDDKQGLQNTYDTFVDKIIGAEGPFMRLFGWLGREAVNLAAKATYKVGEIMWESLFGYNSYMYQAIKLFALKNPVGIFFRALGLLDVGPFKTQEGIFEQSVGKNVSKTLQNLDLKSMASTSNFDEKQADDMGKLYAALKNELKNAQTNSKKNEIQSLLTRMDKEVANFDLNSLRDDKRIQSFVDAAAKIRGDRNAPSVFYKKVKDGVNSSTGTAEISQRAIVTSVSGGIEVAEVSPMDQLLAGMPKGPITNAIRYAGDSANAVYSMISGLISDSQNNQNRQQNSQGRPIEIVLKLDNDVIARKLLSNDFVYKASTLEYTRGSTRLSDNAKVNMSGGSNEISSGV